MINSVCVAPPCDAERLPNRWNATIATSGLRNLMDERPVVNGIRGEEATAMRSSSRLNAEDICKGPSPWDSFSALVKTKMPARLHHRAHAPIP